LVDQAVRRAVFGGAPETADGARAPPAVRARGCTRGAAAQGFSKKKLYLPGSALSQKKICTSGSAQFSSVQVKKKGSHFLDPHKRPKTLKKRPKTPKNAPKRPKTPQKRPKTPQKRPFLAFVFSVQFSLN
jgi:hypothetical protein